MKWLLILAPFAIALAAAIATVVVGGLLFPKSHTVSRSIRLPAAPEAVWAVITDFPTHPEWRKGLGAMERLPDLAGHPVWQETDRRGQKIPVEITESDPPRRMATRIADPKLPFGGTWTYELAPDGPGTRLRITENGEIYNPAFRYISRIIGQSATIEGYTKALAGRLGVEGTIEP